MAENQQTFQNAMSRGNSAAWELDWASAAEFYLQALEEMPNSALALSSMGLALYEQRQYDQALNYYKKAALANSGDPAAVEKIADIFERQGRLKDAVQALIRAAELNLKIHDAQKAINCFEQASSLEPENLTAHNRLAMIFERMDNKQRAIDEYLAVASVYQRNGNPVRAAQTVDHCLKMDATNLQVIEAMGLLKERKLLPEPKRPRDVAASLRMAEVMEPKKDPTTKQLIKVEDTLPVDYFQQKSMVVLASFLFEPSTINITKGKNGRGEEERTGISILLNKAVDALTHQRTEEAVDHFESLVRSGLNESAIYYNLGCLLLESQPKKAIDYLEQCLRRDDYALGAYLMLGKLFYQRSGMQNLRRAAAFYIRALGMADLYTVDSTKHVSLKESYQAVLDTPQRLNEEKELKIICDTIESQVNRKDWMGYLSKVRAQLPESDPKHPAPLSDLMLNMQKGEVVESIAHLQGLVAEQKYDSAMEEAFFALTIAPNYLPLHIEIARLLALKGDVAQSIQKYRIISRLYLLNGESAQAAKMLEAALALSPSDTGLRLDLIAMLIEYEKVEAGLEQYMALAEQYELIANFDQMRRVYFDALRLAARIDHSRGWSLRILNQIAEIDMKRLDWHRAQRVYEQIRILLPNDAGVRQQLVGVYYRLGQDQAADDEITDFLSTCRHAHQTELGIPLIKGLMEVWPHKYSLRQHYAELLLQLNRKEEALDQLNSLASAYLDEGDQQNTTRVLQQMIAIDPEHAGEYQLVVDRVRRLSGKQQPSSGAGYANG